MSIPAPTRAAARERAFRSFGTGIGLDVAIAIAAAVMAWLPAADVSSRQAWTVLGVVVLKSVLQAAAAYVLRLRLAPTEEVDGAFRLPPATP